jgi:hypothetical protein
MICPWSLLRGSIYFAAEMMKIVMMSFYLEQLVQNA